MDKPVPPLTFEECDPALRQLLAPTVERLGYFGEFFQAIGHLPEALVKFMEYTATVKAPLDDRHNELLALTVCSRLGADYELIQHERLATRLGLERDWIAELTGRAQPQPSRLTDEDRDLRALALAMIERQGRDVDAEIAAVAGRLDARRTVAVLLQITRFLTIAHLNNALRMSLPVASIFEDEGR